MHPEISIADGFKSITFFLDEETNEYGGFSLWESKEHAEASIEESEIKLENALSDMVTSPPTRRVVEIYDPEL